MTTAPIAATQSLPALLPINSLAQIMTVIAVAMAIQSVGFSFMVVLYKHGVHVYTQTNREAHATNNTPLQMMFRIFLRPRINAVNVETGVRIT